MEEVVGFGEVRLQLRPCHVFGVKAVPFQNGNLVKTCFGDGRDGFVDPLFHGEWWFGDDGRDVAFFEAVEEIFNHFCAVLPWRIELLFVGALFGWGCPDISIYQFV